MDNEQKKFEFPEMIFMTLIAASSDVSEVVSDLALPLPVVGIVVFGAAKTYSLSVWFGLQFWLIMKGERGLAFAAASIVEMTGLPAQTAGILLTMYLANHPKLAQAAAIGTAVVAAGAVAGAGAAGTAAEEIGSAAAATETEVGAAAAETGAVGAAASGSKAAGAGFRTEEGVRGEATGGIGETEEQAEKTGGPVTKEAGAENEVPLEALGEERPPIEKLKKELTEETPGAGRSYEERNNDKENDSIQLDDENNEVNLKR